MFLNQGNGSFQLAANTDPSSFMVSDLTGKGVVDLLGGKSNLEIWPNNGSLAFSSSPITFSDPTANIEVADTVGGGFADVVSACRTSQCPGQIFYGDRTYQFTPVTVTNLDWPYIVGDFNGDGKADIATDYGTFLNTGGRTFQEIVTNALPLLDGAIAAVGDFNGDGKDDVAIVPLGGSGVEIWYSKGDGSFYWGAFVDCGREIGAMAVGNFDGDGRPDVALGTLFSQQACLLLNSGNGEFTSIEMASLIW